MQLWGPVGVSAASPTPGPVAGQGPQCTQAEVCLEFAGQTRHCSQVSVSLGGDALPWGQPPARPTPWLLSPPVITSPALLLWKETEARGHCQGHC